MRASWSCKTNNYKNYPIARSQEFDTKSIKSMRSINENFIRHDSYLSLPQDKFDPFKRRMSLESQKRNYLSPPEREVTSTDIADSVFCSLSPFINRKRFFSDEEKRKNGKSISSKNICSLIDNEDKVIKEHKSFRKSSFSALSKLNPM